MKKFLLNALIFSIPILLLFTPPINVLFVSGENFEAIDDVLISDKKYMIGYKYYQDNYNYIKWKTIIEKPKATVMALGSSRVLQFRREMFNVSFYNAGYTIKSVNDFLPFLKSIPKEKQPKYLNIGLDQWMFNKAYDNLLSQRETNFWATSFVNTPDFLIIKKTWLDIINAKAIDGNIQSRDSINYIGLGAHTSNSGIRNDGSMYYGMQISKLIRRDSTATDNLLLVP